MKDIFIVVFATLSVCFAVSYFIVLRQFIKLKKDFKKLFIEKTLLQEYVDITKSTKVKEQSDDLIHKEHFIKFLSDSRDWAFKYIEDVQFEIKNFIDSVDPDLLYFDEYGKVGSAYPHYEAMVRINNAYKKLKTLMPKDEEIN